MIRFLRLRRPLPRFSSSASSSAASSSFSTTAGGGGAAGNKDKVVVTCSVNGVLTDPARFSVPVTPDEMARSCADAFSAGASVAHIHFRDQRPGRGGEATWDPRVARDVARAIRDRVPDLLLNFTTGTIEGLPGAGSGGPLGPTGGPISCFDLNASSSEADVEEDDGDVLLPRVRGPEMAALNSGSLNYLRATRSGEWAWPPLMFENRVDKVQTMIEAMAARGIVPECECFDTGIVRSIRMYEDVGILKLPYTVSLVMGVASGMPCDPRWVPLLAEMVNPKAQWQAICIGREEVWETLRVACELGGNVRTGLEDTFYLPDGTRNTKGNGELIEHLVKMCREVGREPATAAETREIIGWNALNADPSNLGRL
jgi:3-keto-5-aminohexanoate cleavage enzyme